MSQQIVNEWSYGDKNTNTWLHDGDVERSAADIVALASGVSGIADTFPAAVSAGILEVNAAGATQVAAIEGAGAEQVSLVSSAGAVQCSAVDSAGDAEIASLAGATSTYLGDLQDAGAVQIAAVGSAGSALITSMGAIRDEVVEAETLIVNALGGDEEGTAQEFIDQVVNAADNASAYASAASGYAVAASGYADSIVSGGYVTSSNVSELVDAAVSSGGFVTSGYVSSATVASAGVATKIGTSTVGSTSKPVYISSGVPVSMSVVGSATEATSAGTCTGNAATATDASSLGGVAASSYALDANVVKLSGNQTIGGVKTFTSNPNVENDYPIITLDRSGTDNPSDIRFEVNNDFKAAIRFTNTESLQLGVKGSGSNWSDGPFLTLRYDNAFILRSGYGNSKYELIGTAAGSLTWDGKDIITNGGAQTVGGTKTFPDTILATNDTITMRRTNTTGALRIAGGTDVSGSTGAFLTMFGSGHSNSQYFRLCSGTKWLEGRPDGTLTWQGQPVQTSSDERIKTPLADVPDEVLDAWGDVNWGQFQYLEAVAEKGADKARLHTGLIAQRVKAVFEARKLDACAYGILCHDEHPATEDEPAVDLWTVRYTEAAAMEAAYQRRSADRAEARITALERRLNEMEAVFASLMSPVGDETYAEPEQDAEVHDEVTE